MEGDAARGERAHVVGRLRLLHDQLVRREPARPPPFEHGLSHLTRADEQQQAFELRQCSCCHGADTSLGAGIAKRKSGLHWRPLRKGIGVYRLETLLPEIDAAITEGRAIARIPDLAIEGAHQLFAALHARRLTRGEKNVGRKIGFTNRTIWAEYGVHAPNWGYKR